MNERHLHTSSETSIICTQVSHSIYVRYVYIYIHDILQRVHKAQQIIKNANFIKWTLRKSLNTFLLSRCKCQEFKPDADDDDDD